MTELQWCNVMIENYILLVFNLYSCGSSGIRQVSMIAVSYLDNYWLEESDEYMSPSLAIVVLVDSDVDSSVFFYLKEKQRIPMHSH